jgi:predicted O-methyltransferase YrrM
MGTPLTARVRLKLNRITRGFSADEREWRRIWPLLDSIEGWLTAAEAKWLFDAARSLPTGAIIVEIGSFKGRSTCCLAAGCRGNGKRIFAVDTFDGGSDLPRANSFPDFSENVERCGFSSCIEPVIGLSTEVAKTWNKPIHLLFIDGSHFYEEVLGDFNGFFPHVVRGGIVAFHDVAETKPGVFRAWNQNFKNQLTAIGHCESLGYGRKPGSNGESVQ